MVYNRAFLVWLVVFTAVQCSAVGGQAAGSGGGWMLGLDVTEDSLTVFLRLGEERKTIISHSPQSPFLLVGNGEVTFKEFEGNFDITKYTSHKVPLSYMKKVQNLQDGAFIADFTDNGQAKVRVSITTSEQRQLEVKFLEVSKGLDQFWIRTYSENNEQFYGGGEQFTYFNLKGKNFPIWTREQGVGKNKSNAITFLADAWAGGYGGDYHTTYFPQATFTSSRKFYCHFEENNYMEMDFSRPDYVEVFGLESLPGFHCNAADTYTDIIGQLTWNLGRQPPLPAWIRNGIIMGVQGGTTTMLKHLETLESHGISVSGIWIQDWPGHIFTSFGKRVFWNWEWNPQQYPGLDTEIKVLREEKGIRLLAYITPHLNIKGGLYQVASQKGLLMKAKDNTDYLMNFGEFTCATVDLTNPEAVEWYKGIIKKNLIDFGFGGWMADFSEYIPVDAVFHNGRTGQEVHNIFPVLWAKTNREAVEESGKLGEIMFYMRAGGPGSQQYTIMTWAGDQNVDFGMEDGFPSVIPAALSFGMSGIGFTHFDIGGYTTLVRSGKTETVSVDVQQVRSKELFMRMAETAVFTPVMRTHEGNMPFVNFQIYNDPDAMRQFAVMVNMFKALGEYTEFYIQEHSSTGLPLQRPLFMHYPDDQTSHTVQYQYMYGRDLLVAPVYRANVTSWEVYLPPESGWVHLFTGELYTGGAHVEVDAPIGKPPVFYRQSATTWEKVFKELADMANFGTDRKTEL